MVGSIRCFVSLTVLISALALGACGDDGGGSSSVGCKVSTDCDPGQECVQNRCMAYADTATPDLTGPDTTDTTPAETVDVTPDTAPDTPDVPTPDIPTQDIPADDTPPEIVTTSPADGEDGVDIPFTVTVTFSEPMKTTTIYDQSFTVADIDGKLLAGSITFSDNNTKATFTPSQGVFIASPYRVVLKGSIIQDAAGNRLDQLVEFTFFTRPPQDMQAFYDLAAKYAPIITQATDEESPHYDYITSFNFDGNWDGADNKQHIQVSAGKVPSVVYYDVVQTQSHTFISYLFFYPFRDAENTDHRFDNDASGAMVVLTRHPEVPVAVETWYKYQSDEQSHAFVTTESGIVPDGESAESYRVNKLFAQADLFPNDRFQGYLTSHGHQSCLWDWEGTGTVVSYCKLSAAQKTQLESHHIQYVYKGVAEELVKQNDAFPVVKDDVGYELVSIVGELWPRRREEGLVAGSEMSYTPPDTRPGGGLKFGKSFVSSMDGDFGRPPWAWKWKPAGVIPYYELPRGTWFLDPAWYVSRRHSLYEEWNAEAKTGYSTTYCFNPYFNIDQRNNDDCK